MLQKLGTLFFCIVLFSATSVLCQESHDNTRDDSWPQPTDQIWAEIEKSFFDLESARVENDHKDRYSNLDPVGKWQNRWVKSKVNATSEISSSVKFADGREIENRYPDFSVFLTLSADQVVVRKDLVKDQNISGGARLSFPVDKPSKIYIEGLAKTGLGVILSPIKMVGYRSVMLCPRDFIDEKKKDGKFEKNLKYLGFKPIEISYKGSAGTSGELTTGSINAGAAVSRVATHRLPPPKHHLDKSTGPNISVDLDYLPVADFFPRPFEENIHGAIRASTEINFEKVMQVSFSESSISYRQVEIDKKFSVPIWGVGFEAEPGLCVMVALRNLSGAGFARHAS